MVGNVVIVRFSYTDLSNTLLRLTDAKMVEVLAAVRSLF